MLRKLSVFLLCLIVLVSGCIQESQNQGAQPETRSLKELATEKCEELCKAALSKGLDLSNGPCLSTSNPSWNIPGWVCDIAHDPRAPVDNLKENQCPEWGISAKSFVEFTPECKLIRTYEGR